jgi:hypothetical protein
VKNPSSSFSNVFLSWTFSNATALLLSSSTRFHSPSMMNIHFCSLAAFHLNASTSSSCWLGLSRSRLSGCSEWITEWASLLLLNLLRGKSLSQLSSHWFMKFQFWERAHPPVWVEYQLTVSGIQW